jgi:hypothetical protein
MRVEPLRAAGRFAPDPHRDDISRALVRFSAKCRHEPETGCVVWTGGRTMGRGHHVPYGAFKFAGRRWFAHRWAARYIQGLDIDAYQVDHCCPNIPVPNTLCVEHLQALTPARNRELQHMRRKLYIHLQVGLLRYEDVYGSDAAELEDLIPFHPTPAWLIKGETRGPDDCPF